MVKHTCGKRLRTVNTQGTCIETGGGNGDAELESGNLGGGRRRGVARDEGGQGREV